MTTERQVYEIMRKKTDNPLSLNLAGNKLIFQDHRKWIIGRYNLFQSENYRNNSFVIDSSDLDVAVSEIMELARENEVLKLQLSDVRMELTKSEQMKRASMNLVMIYS